MRRPSTTDIRQRKDQYQRVEKLARILLFPQTYQLFQALGLERWDMHRRAKVGKQGYSQEFLVKLKRKYPQVNTEWLLTGEGDPTLDGSTRMDVLKETSTGYGKKFIMNDIGMADVVMKGDELFTKPMNLEDIRIWGDIYVVQTHKETLVRYLNYEEPMIILTGNANTVPVKLLESEIKSLHKVTGIHRSI